ncbi:MAG: UPF0104 family protein [Phenylobacterium sp.]|nr:MAG: UPF0104 family protein [Phenylobacterium sp.]
MLKPASPTGASTPEAKPPQGLGPQGLGPNPVEDELAKGLPAVEAHPLARVTKLALRIVPLVLLVVAFFVLRHEFRGLSWTAVAKAMDGWGHPAIAAAIGLSVFSFLLMGIIEQLGLRWVGARLPWRVAIAGSFLASAIGHAIGANLLVAGAIRARLYDRYNVGLTQVAATTLFGGMSFAVGLGALGGGGLILATTAELSATAIPLWLARTAGALMLAGALGWIAICFIRHEKPISAFGRSVRLPSTRDAVIQLVIGVIDNGVAAAIVWVLLPHGTTSYASFVGAYAVACVAGLISSVPGGAGVFESAITTLLPSANAAALAAAFLGYRLVFYLAPLVIAAVALAADTVFRSHRR